MGLQDDLQRISELQGKMVPRGDRIEGFGPTDPPVPDIPSAREFYGAPIEVAPEQAPEPEAFDEPVIEPFTPLVTRVSPQAKPSPEPDVSLIVLDGEAEYQGRKVKLTAVEQAKVSYVILRAILRSIREQEAEVQAKLPKKNGKVKAVEVVKKRGRPRKVVS